ncbi:hypothetical protein Dimus_005212 [Dionaea muscipula]
MKRLARSSTSRRAPLLARKPLAAHDEGAREEGNRCPQLDAAARRRAAACMAMRRVYWPHEGEAVAGVMPTARCVPLLANRGAPLHCSAPLRCPPSAPLAAGAHDGDDYTDATRVAAARRWSSLLPFMLLAG